MFLGEGADFVVSGCAGFVQQPRLQGAAPAGFEAVPLVGAGSREPQHAESAFLSELDQIGQRHVYAEVVPHRRLVPEGPAGVQPTTASQPGPDRFERLLDTAHAWLLLTEMAMSVVPAQRAASLWTKRTRSATPRTSALRPLASSSSVMSMPVPSALGSASSSRSSPHQQPRSTTSAASRGAGAVLRSSARPSGIGALKSRSALCEQDRIHPAQTGGAACCVG
ncbi:hypothetical protein A8926_0247 [Saccharopolyspora spinosa]|uniref:Uncharacterized protein n=1 Tax=Saccharopolyspora spinosa TaxID=60894 RepID=A0A2N3XQ88_SACSN|nr:hypothetical protein A8926_0247 [Saccharopolyspora spinosa]